MADKIDLGKQDAAEMMQRTVVDIANRAVATKQIGHVDAAIGCMYAAFDLYRATGLGEEATLALMRQMPDIMARALKEARLPRLDI